ncbi:Insecticidal delta-endotoxin CryVIIIC(a) [Serratia quinivorans]|uniref:insecticidal delta-endotoxin Cry8Ea1 family protein n=1 Tax=Serratia quinivorans TaxID=137545 RepID=UPI0021780788|nr:insecticidal delta-endotoxin Cry8Ea1 family protein [Serratia quinivorans]CAI2001092.1 Insecticidal delta-endotoxin CryVIIIC(a) [Serratia quinivorans]
MSNIIHLEEKRETLPFHVYHRTLFEFDMNGILKETVIHGIKYIPKIGPLLSVIVKLFWPNNQADIWKSIVERLTEYVEERIINAIRGILLGDIAQLKGKIESVEAAFKDHPGSVEARDLYMSVNVILDSIHLKFTTFEHRYNYEILPLYSTTIMLQLMYWTMGIERKDDIGLTANQVNEIKHNIDKLAKQADVYIKNLQEVEVEKRINTSDISRVATDVMDAHYYCGMHGMEYLEIAHHVHQHETLSKGFYPTTLCYSTLFGYNTSNARIMAFKDESERTQPLKPDLTAGKYNPIKLITGNIVRIGGAPRVGGIGITFENGESYHQGTRSQELTTIDLKGRIITSIETWGTDALDELMFTLNDGTLFRVGERYSQNYHKFYADGHYIAGIFLSSDRSELAGQAANICLTFHRKTD